MPVIGFELNSNDRPQHVFIGRRDDAVINGASEKREKPGMDVRITGEKADDVLIHAILSSHPTTCVTQGAAKWSDYEIIQCSFST